MQMIDPEGRPASSGAWPSEPVLQFTLLDPGSTIRILEWIPPATTRAAIAGLSASCSRGIEPV
jgi:hypothetical protein